MYEKIKDKSNYMEVNLLWHCLEKRKRKKKSLFVNVTSTILYPKKQTSECYSKVQEDICCIKVLGSGCVSCHTLYENAKEAVQKMGLMVEVEYVTDLQKVMGYGVMSMPALVVNEKVVSKGKVLKSSDVEKLLHNLGF